MLCSKCLATFLKSRLGLLPQFVADQPKMRNFPPLPFGLWPLDDCDLPTFGMSHQLCFITVLKACVHFALEQVGNGFRRPGSSAANFTVIEVLGNLLRAALLNSKCRK